MRKLLLSLFLLISVTASAGTVQKYFDYGAFSEVTSVNLNGNLDNIITALNGGLTNDNAATADGYRFVEIVGMLPAAGNQGRVVFSTADNVLYFDTGTAFVRTLTLGTSAAQGDIFYFNGTIGTSLPKNTTSERYLANNGTSNNPNWDKVNLILGGEWEGQATGDIVFASSSTVVARLPVGSSNQELVVSGGKPSWQNKAIAPSVTGSLLTAFADTEQASSGTSYVKVKEIYVPNAGTLRIDFELKSSGGGNTRAQIYRNDVAVGTEQVDGDAVYNSFSESISGWSAGDRCQLWIRENNVAGAVKNFRIYEAIPQDYVVTLD